MSKPKPNKQHQEYRLQIIEAISKDKPSDVQRILLNCPESANFTTSSGDTVLQQALCLGFCFIAELLIKAKASVDPPLPNTNHAETPLKLVVLAAKKEMLNQRNELMKILNMLIAAGADVNRGNANGVTPLHEAVVHDLLSIAEVLIKAGANVNLKNRNEQTPLVCLLHMGPHAYLR